MQVFFKGNMSHNICCLSLRLAIAACPLYCTVFDCLAIFLKAEPLSVKAVKLLLLNEAAVCPQAVVYISYCLLIQTEKCFHKAGGKLVSQRANTPTAPCTFSITPGSHVTLTLICAANHPHVSICKVMLTQMCSE